MPLTKKNPHLIPPEAYPQMMNRSDAARAMLSLRSAQTLEKAQAAMEACAEPMRKAILQYVDEMEGAGQDTARIYDRVHEIRGFAETAGMVTTGRIAEILCRYMDDMARIAKPLDETIVTLHVAAIVRAARAEDGDEKTGDLVAAELAGLVARRLAEAGV